MDPEELLTDLSQGREIEFEHRGRKYFLQPDYDNSDSDYILYDCTSPESNVVFHGPINAVMSFKFDGKCSLKQDLPEFYFICIL